MLLHELNEKQLFVVLATKSSIKIKKVVAGKNFNIPEDLKLVIDKLDRIENMVKAKQPDYEDYLVDNRRFLKIMKVSSRTAETWRDEGIISFSQIGNRIYYRMSDIQKLLDANTHSAFNKK